MIRKYTSYIPNLLAPCWRFGDRLPVLPQFRRNLRIRRDAANRDLHDVSFAGVDGRADARAGAPESCHPNAAAMEPCARFAGFRVLQSQHPCEQRDRVLDVSRRGGPDAADLEREYALHEMVSGLPQEAGAIPAAKGPGIQSALGSDGRSEDRRQETGCSASYQQHATH